MPKIQKIPFAYFSVQPVSVDLYINIYIKFLGKIESNQMIFNRVFLVDRLKFPELSSNNKYFVMIFVYKEFKISFKNLF